MGERFIQDFSKFARVLEILIPLFFFRGAGVAQLV
jgi:hypothetical protein